MSLIFVEGFDHYADIDHLLQGKWTAIYHTSSTFASFEPGQFRGQHALALNSGLRYLKGTMGRQYRKVPMEVLQIRLIHRTDRQQQHG